MEQLLINELLEFISKAGGEQLITELLYESNEDNNPRTWTEDEVDKAITFLHSINTSFGREPALEIIKTLQAKYKLTANDISLCLPETEKLAAREEL